LQIGGVMNLALRTQPQRLRGVAAHRHHRRLLTSLQTGSADGAREAITADIMSAGDDILAGGTLPN
jgi:DNA-binding GntR family transcriptional regulator